MKWHSLAACLCAFLLILLIAGSLCSPAVKEHLRPVLTWYALPPIVRMYQHRILHLLGFGFPAVILFNLCRNRIAVIAGALSLAVMAVALEYLQHRIYSSPLEWWDIRDDLAAIAMAVFLDSAWRICEVKIT